MTQLELITGNYWLISQALRGGTPPAITLTTESALKLVNTGDLLPLESWRLRDLMHIVKFDIIEGNTKWQNKQEPQVESIDSKLIQFTKD